ncbi:helix-turn-helix domain-containing protein [Amycolatopsis pithecellobii]|uniref:Helix-turn-helix domain-containing protein n=1 Tax=Amycolatopsis pithecellobii TaxID=664692 RepID=A0A6N7Z6B3_9PSEU|nr:helix-turn-helix domain-containing protein [Amycolatopsis pithecellobii]MTD56384.1 helix-turn-helix domain-containing protein [Amycolatopsis pithecellobii]
MTAEGSLTLDRGLALLQAVADAGAEATTISELAASIGASRAAVYRLLVPLSERGLVRRDGSKVRLGVGVLRLAGQVVPQLREVARPALRALAESSGATAHLSIAEGDEVESVVVVEPSWTNLHVAYRVGVRQPIGVGAAGKALTLRQGSRAWATSKGEVQHGVAGLAAPVRGVPGLRASVGVVALGTIRAETVGPQVVEAAAELAAALS